MSWWFVIMKIWLATWNGRHVFLFTSKCWWVILVAFIDVTLHLKFNTLWWWHLKGSIFSISSAYLAFLECGPPLVAALNPMALAFPFISGSWPSFKVVVFFWKLLQDKVPSRDNILKQMVLMDLNGGFRQICKGSVEYVFLLFVTCVLVSFVWYKIFRWLGRCLVFLRDLSSLFQIFSVLVILSKYRGGMFTILHFVLWSI